MTRFRAALVAAFLLLATFAPAQSTPVNGSRSLPYVNDQTTGTAQYYLATGNGSPSSTVVTSAPTDVLSSVVGICDNFCGTSGMAWIANYGLQKCTFDNATTANDTVTIGTGGACHDTGSRTAAGVAIVQSTNASAGTYQVVWTGASTSSTGGGPGSPGVGVPTGGTVGQALVKNSTTNYDTIWQTISGSFVWPGAIPSGTTIPYAQVTGQPTIPNLAAPGAIGGTTPAAATFTTVAVGPTVLDPVNGVSTPKVTIIGAPAGSYSKADGTGYGTPAIGGGTVTNVSLSMPNLLYSVSGSPCSVTCVLALALLAQPAHAVVMGPTSGADAAPTVRLLVAADIPTLPKSQVGLGNVDNTSDANKPVSTAQATAIAAGSALTRPFVFPGAWNGTIPASTYLNTFLMPTYATTALVVTFPANCTGSSFYAHASATASATFALQKNGTTICTATIAAGAVIATWSGTGGTLTFGDRLEWLGGGDFTLAGISINAAGTQTGGVQ